MSSALLFSSCVFCSALLTRAYAWSHQILPQQPPTLVVMASHESPSSTLWIASSSDDENKKLNDSLTKTIDFNNLQNQLKPPSEFQPQIMLQQSSQAQAQAQARTVQTQESQKKKAPILSGLVYFQNSQDELFIRQLAYDDTVTASTLVMKIEITNSPIPPSKPKGGEEENESKSTSSIVLAGAKIPISKIPRFPSQFNLYKSNIIMGSPSSSMSPFDYWKNVAFKQDLYAHVSIVAITTTDDTTTNNITLYRGVGLSKAITDLPGMNPDDVVRSAASIALTKTADL